jgi:hypothetical protein
MVDLGHLPGHLLQRFPQADCGERLNLGIVRMRPQMERMADARYGIQIGVERLGCGCDH